MKKNIMVFASLLLTMAMLGGCSGGNNKETEPETTVAETTEAETEAEEEEPEEDSLNGVVVKIDGNEVTVQNSDDGNEYRFDISDAEIIRQYPLSEGDEVYVEYYVGNQNPKTALIYEVEEPYLASVMDPYLTGTVTASDDDTVTMVTDDGNEYTFFTTDAYIVTANGINPDTNVEITFIGEPDDEPYAIKIVTEDCYGTADAEKNGFVGIVAEINDNEIILISGDDDYFNFVSDSLDFDDYDEGDRVLIIYDGLITDKEIQALQISNY